MNSLIKIVLTKLVFWTIVINSTARQITVNLEYVTVPEFISEVFIESLTDINFAEIDLLIFQHVTWGELVISEVGFNMS